MELYLPKSCKTLSPKRREMLTEFLYGPYTKQTTRRFISLILANIYNHRENGEKTVKGKISFSEIQMAFDLNDSDINGFVIKLVQSLGAAYFFPAKGSRDYIERAMITGTDTERSKHRIAYTLEPKFFEDLDTLITQLAVLPINPDDIDASKLNKILEERKKGNY